jgi:hypothetical protein
MGGVHSILEGAVSMASLVAALFFLRFWTRTRDEFFLLFAIAFAIDAVTRFVFTAAQVSNQPSEPFYYLPRLVVFGLIIFAVVRKNRPRAGR